MGTFTIQNPDPATLSVEQGARGTASFTVTNTGDSFRNLGVRVAVLNAVGDEDPDAASAAWFSAAVTGDSFVPAAGHTTVELTAAVPLDASVGDQTIRLVAFDSDLADEDFTDGQPVTMTVTQKVVEEEPDAGIPFWVWIAVGVGALALIIGIVIAVTSGGGEEPVAEVTPEPTPEETTQAPASQMRQLQILFKAFEGDDPLAGAVGGVTIKVESPIAATKTVTTNPDGDGGVSLCVVTDASASVPNTCVKVLDSVQMRATKSGYKDTPTTTLKVAGLLEAPKTYVKMTKATSDAKPIRPIVVPEKEKPLDIRDYIDRHRVDLEASGGTKLEMLRRGTDLRATNAGTLHLTNVPKASVKQVAQLLVRFGDVTDEEAMKLARAASAGQVLAVPGIPADRQKQVLQELNKIGVAAKIK